ncbi:helix-turn-helix domain-containing protein [Halococcus sediminicola]|uniref:helix-turn-helix domain-containing protein n=1 Tax=Halococcus sediminicola TaxID=1264579 RepID=UPI00067912AD|nr:helix-turn-helix domain-containing protein [Halococcus sediminicola]
MAERTRPVSAPTPQLPAATDASTAQFELPAEGFAFVELFERVPDATVELEPAIANPDDHALVIVQANAPEHTIDAAIRSSPNVAAVERFGGEDGHWRYRVTWDEHARQVIRRLITESITLVSLHGKAGRWKLRVIASKRDAIARAYETLEELGCAPECHSISTLGNGGIDSGGLTHRQHTALTRAFEMGYYNIPRDLTSAELATDLGVSHQALSERFRRAHRELIQNANIIE